MVRHPRLAAKYRPAEIWWCGLGRPVGNSRFLSKHAIDRRTAPTACSQCTGSRPENCRHARTDPTRPRLLSTASVALAIQKPAPSPTAWASAQTCPPVGSVVPSNLTPAGQLSHLANGESLGQIARPIDADGHWLT